MNHKQITLRSKESNYSFIPHQCEICNAKLYYKYIKDLRTTNYCYYKGFYFCDNCFRNREKIRIFKKERKL